MGLRKVTVLGGGAGGYATAVELTLKGLSVTLFEMPQFAAGISEAKAKGGIEARGPAVSPGFVPIHNITTDISQALAEAEIVFMCLPAFGIETFARHCARHLHEDQPIVMLMSSALGSLLFRKTVQEVVGNGLLIAEATALPFACRKLEGNAVNIWLRFHHVPIATFPARETPRSVALLENCRQLFPALVPVRHVMEVALNNGNPITHPGASLLNAGQIEAAKGDFFLYGQGMTPGVTRVIEAVDQERIAVGRAVGLELVTNAERLVRVGLSRPSADLYETYCNSEVLPAVKGPSGIMDRYLTEDIPFGLVLWSSLARTLGVATPCIEGLIEIGSALCEKDFRARGITVERLGIDGLDALELDRFLITGERKEEL